MQEIVKILEAIVEKEKADGCQMCAFENTEEWELPCRKCKRNCKDYWRPKKEEVDNAET